jgi:hypothetical protein
MDKGIFFSRFRHAKTSTDSVDFPILKIPEWYFLQCTVKLKNLKNFDLERCYGLFYAFWRLPVGAQLQEKGPFRKSNALDGNNHSDQIPSMSMGFVRIAAKKQMKLMKGCQA